MDNCNADNDFRLAVKRTRPKSLQEAVTAAMQEECIRMTENRNLRSKENNPIRPVYGVSEFPRNAEVPVTKKPYRAESEEKRRIAKSATDVILLCICTKTVQSGKSLMRNL